MPSPEADASVPFGADSGRSPADAGPVEASGIDGGTKGSCTEYGAVGDPSRWATFDVSTLGWRLRGFGGAAFDGRYLDLAPFNTGALVARYDTRASGGLAAAASWATFGPAPPSA